MNANYYEVTSSITIDQVDKSVFETNYLHQNGMFFVTILESTSASLEQFLVGLNFSEPAVFSALHPRNISIVLPTDKEVYFEYAVCAYGEANEPLEQYLSFLCLENLIICLNIGSIMDEEALQTITKQLKLVKNSVPSLLSGLMAREALLLSKSALELRSNLYALDERMDNNPDDIELNEIHEQKKVLRTYDAVSNAQESCLGMLKSLDKSLLPLIAYPMYIQLAQTTSTNTSYILLRLEKTIRDLSQRYDANAQDKMNHRLGVLTIISAIFMPITFLAGIFGMNFDNMPGLHFTWSYPIALSVMSMIAIGLYIYFKKHGWLEE